MDDLVGGAGREGGVVFPIHVQRRRLVKGKLLFDLRIRRVPNDRRLVHARRQNVFAVAVPLEGEDGSRVPTQVRNQVAVRRPDARVSVVRSRRQLRTSTESHIYLTHYHQGSKSS